MNRQEEEYTIVSLRLKVHGGMSVLSESAEYIFDTEGNVTHSIESDRELFDSGDNYISLVSEEMTKDLFKYLKRVNFYKKFKNQLYDGPIIFVTDIASFEIELGFYYRTEIYDLKSIELSTVTNLYNKILRIMSMINY